MTVKPQFFFLALLLFAGLSAAALRDVKSTRLPALPDIVFYDKSEKPVSLKDFHGKVVLVNLWATWCPPCIVELPQLQRLEKRLPEGFALVALSLDMSSMKDVQAFLAQKRVMLSTYWDKDRQVPLMWKYKGLPTSFLLDAHGRVVKQYDGVHTWDAGPVFDEIRNLVAAQNTP